MPLSDDQKALLRLLSQREQGYEDIAALKGKSVAEVREEVRDALATLDAPPPEPPPPAPAPGSPSSPPTAAEDAPAKVEAPSGEDRASVGGQAKSSMPTPSQPDRTGRPRSVSPVERRRFVLVAAGALGVVAVVLAAVALFGGDSDSSAPTGEGALGETVLSESSAATDERVTRAVLRPVAGGDAEGLAVFGRAGKQVRLGIAAKGLEAAPKGKAYVVWLADSAGRMVPVTPVAANASGEIAVQQQIPGEVLLYLAGGVFDEIDISLVSAGRYRAAVARAQKQNKLPSYSGSDVLRGKISGPIVDAAQRKG